MESLQNVGETPRRTHLSHCGGYISGNLHPILEGNTLNYLSLDCLPISIKTCNQNIFEIFLNFSDGTPSRIGETPRMTLMAHCDGYILANFHTILTRNTLKEL